MDQSPAQTPLAAELADALDLLARAQRALDRHAESRDAYQEAYGIRQELLARQPGSTQRILDVIRSQSNLAAWNLAQNTAEHDDEADSLLTTAQARLGALREEGRFGASLDTYERWNATLQRNRRILGRHREAASSPVGG